MRTLTQTLSLAIFSAALVAAAQPAVAQQPKVVNAQLSTVGGGNLQQVIAGAANQVWVGYSEPTLHPVHTNWDDGVQYLEGRPKQDDDSPKENTQSNDATQFVVLFRVMGGRVAKVSIADPTRTLDVGGLPFVWVNDVSQAASLRTLNSIAEQGIISAAPAAEGVKSSTSGRAIVDSSILAMALHSAPEATAAVRTFAADRYPEWVREKAAFWLANSRGADGFQAVKNMVQSDKSDALRSKLVFDLTLVKGDSRQAALDELIALARNDASAKVRKDAQFWLAQQVGRNKSADPRITETLRSAVSSDPEASIRKSAVFALSRLPADQAATELIRVASTSNDPAVRHEAVFWLGQTKDARALDYLEKLARQ